MNTNSWVHMEDSPLWNDIKQAVHDEVQRIRVAMKVFPVRPHPNEQTVSTDVTELDTLAVEESATPFIEISRGFALRQRSDPNN